MRALQSRCSSLAGRASHCRGPGPGDFAAGATRKPAAYIAAGMQHAHCTLGKFAITFPERAIRSVKTRISRVLLTSAAAIVTAAGLTASPALASTSQAAADGCVWIIGDTLIPGTINCAYSQTDYEFPDGSEESFVIGMSGAVWTAWNSSGSWEEKSMGGNAVSPVYLKYEANWFLQITAKGDGGPFYCNDRGQVGSAGPSSGWGGWYEC